MQWSANLGSTSDELELDEKGPHPNDPAGSAVLNDNHVVVPRGSPHISKAPYLYRRSAEEASGTLKAGIAQVANARQLGQAIRDA